MKNSPYFVPQTQCNEQGVPQGAYFDFTKFIADMKFKTGAYVRVSVRCKNGAAVREPCCRRRAGHSRVHSLKHRRKAT